MRTSDENMFVDYKEKEKYTVNGIHDEFRVEAAGKFDTRNIIITTIIASLLPSFLKQINKTLIANNIYIFNSEYLSSCLDSLQGVLKFYLIMFFIMHVVGKGVNEWKKIQNRPFRYNKLLYKCFADKPLSFQGYQLVKNLYYNEVHFELYEQNHEYNKLVAFLKNEIIKIKGIRYSSSTFICISWILKIVLTFLFYIMSFIVYSKFNVMQFFYLMDISSTLLILEVVCLSLYLLIYLPVYNKSDEEQTITSLLYTLGQPDKFRYYDYFKSTNFISAINHCNTKEGMKRLLNKKYITKLKMGSKKVLKYNLLFFFLMLILTNI